MEDLLLFPCNGNAMEALDCLGTSFRPVAFIDDDPQKIGTTLFGLPICGRDALSHFRRAKLLAVPGSPSSFHRRADVIADLAVEAERFATVIHPQAVVSRNAGIGVNALIMAGVVITSNAIIEDHVIVLPNTVVH